MKRLGFTVAKNALANLIRGGAGGIVALVLPHFLTRSMDHDRFAAWALMLQIAAYANYLDFGLQTAVARYLAQAMERGDDEQRDRLVSTAFAILTMAGATALLIFGVIVFFLPVIFHGIPISLVGDLRLGLTFLAAGAAIGLPMSTFTGVLLGLHRNEFPAAAIGGAKVVTALAVLIAVRYTHTLAWLALCIAAPNLLAWLAQYLISRAFLPRMRVGLSQLTMSMARELATYCTSLTIFSAGMLLVSGLDVTLVGYFDFGAVGYYAVAVTVIAVFVALNGAVVSAIMTPVAVLQTRMELKRIKDLLLLTTSLNTYANLIFTSLIFLLGNAILSAWVGAAYEQGAAPILDILMLAQTIRMIGSPYSTVLAATGQQRYAISYAIAEAVGNLVCSLVGIVVFGPIGVAWGTLVGSVISIVCMLSFAMPRARVIPVGRRLFLWTAVIKPVLLFVPVISYVVFSFHRQASIFAVTSCVFYTLFLGYFQSKTLAAPFLLGR